MQSGTSKPRAATSVATSTDGLPRRKAIKACSRSRCERSPWMLVAGTEDRKRNSSSCSAALFVSTKMIVRPVQLDSCSSRTRRLSFSSAHTTDCVINAVVEPTLPTATNMYRVMNSLANRWISFGKVAENINVCRSPDMGMPSRSTTRRICGSKPMSNMRSASSRIRCKTLCSEHLPRSIKSHNRPGVATRRWQPRSRFQTCPRMSAPP